MIYFYFPACLWQMNRCFLWDSHRLVTRVLVVVCLMSWSSSCYPTIGIDNHCPPQISVRDTLDQFSGWHSSMPPSNYIQHNFSWSMAASTVELSNCHYVLNFLKKFYDYEWRLLLSYNYLYRSTWVEWRSMLWLLLWDGYKARLSPNQSHWSILSQFSVQSKKVYMMWIDTTGNQGI